MHTDERIDPPPTTGRASRLRDYQLEAVEKLRDAVRGGARRICVVAPTGAGKTILFAFVASQRIARGGRVLVVAHRRELVRQASRHLAANGLTEARVFLGGSSLGSQDAPVAIAAVQTLAAPRWADRCPPADLVIWDECHHITCESFRTVLDRYPDAIHLGFTATPERHDHTPLGDVFESMVVVSSIRELTERGWLVPCVVWAPPSDRQQLADDPADAYLEHGQGKRAIVFCANVHHSKSTAARLQSEGVAAEHVDGSMGQRARDETLARFAAGRTQVITNVSLITEGFDVPACKCIVIARGCDSAALYLQAIGRALRPEPGEPHALLIDLRGAVHKHGMPDDDREFSLDGDAIRSTADKAPAIRQCLVCGRVFRARPTCPHCGAAVPEPKDPAIRREILQRISAAHTDDQRRKYFDRLWSEAKLKGYKPGWVAARFKARYGVWPTFRETTREAGAA